MEESITLPIIHSELCTGCNLCGEYCPGDAVGLVDHKPEITNPENCSYCGICEEICPELAIELLYQIG